MEANPQGVSVLVPRTLMPLVGDQRNLQVPLAETATVAVLLDLLAEQYPVFVRRVRDETGALRRYVNVYVDGEDVRRLDGLLTPVGPGHEITVLQSVAGG